MAQVNDLNIINIEDGYSSVNCESSVTIVTESDIVRGKMDKY